MITCLYKRPIRAEPRSCRQCDRDPGVTWELCSLLRGPCECWCVTRPVLTPAEADAVFGESAERKRDGQRGGKEAAGQNENLRKVCVWVYFWMSGLHPGASPHGYEHSKWCVCVCVPAWTWCCRVRGPRWRLWSRTWGRGSRLWSSSPSTASLSKSNVTHHQISHLRFYMVLFYLTPGTSHVVM